MTQTDINETLWALRKALHRPGQDPVARARAIEAAARELDERLSEGGPLPEDWAEDRISSASRQHYIETGRYLTREDYAGTAVLDRLYDVAGDYEVSVLDELTRRAELRWTCPSCDWVNTAEAAGCEMCPTARPKQDSDDAAQEVA